MFLKKSAKPLLQGACLKFRGEEEAQPATGTHNFSIAHHESKYLPAVFMLISATLHVELTFKGGDSFDPLPFFFFPARPPLLWPLGRGLQLACWPPAARWR